MKIKFFISGIMKGDIINKGLYDQSYRPDLSNLIKKKYPDAEILGYNELYPNNISSVEEEEKAFFELIEQASQSDVIIAFLPKASMGTAIEIWEAHKKGKIILTVSPLLKNWTIKFLSSRVFDNFSNLEKFLLSNSLEEIMRKRNLSSDKKTN